MSELQVADVARMTVPGDRDDMVDGGAHRMRVLERFVNRLAADRAHALGSKNDLAVGLELCAVRAVTIWPGGHGVSPLG